MRYVIFEDPSNPLAAKGSLSAAFADVLMRAEREAVWDRSATGEITLQFRYLAGPLKGEIIGAEHGEPETYSAPSGGGREFAKRLTMSHVLNAGLCGFYACKESDLHRSGEVNTEELSENLRKVSA